MVAHPLLIPSGPPGREHVYTNLVEAFAALGPDQRKVVNYLSDVAFAGWPRERGLVWSRVVVMAANSDFWDGPEVLVPTDGGETWWLVNQTYDGLWACTCPNPLRVHRWCLPIQAAMVRSGRMPAKLAPYVEDHERLIVIAA